MKITVDVDATPKELREFLGMPDVQPLQDEMLEQLRAHLHTGTGAFDPAVALKPLLAGNLQSVETWQKALWTAFAKGMQPRGAAATKGERTDKGGKPDEGNVE
jgi:hypothetical protein